MNCNRLNLLLLGAMGDESLTAGYAPRARNVRRTWVHMYHARLGWLGAVMENPPTLPRIKSREAHTVEDLQAAFEESGLAIAEMLDAFAKKKLVPGFDRSPLEVLTYMVTHEAHHRGQMIVALRMAGKPVPRSVLLDLWDY